LIKQRPKARNFISRSGWNYDNRLGGVGAHPREGGVRPAARLRIYNKDVVLARLPILLLLILGFQTLPAQQQAQEPPEEDELQKPQEYSFNPLRSNKDVQTGNYYFKRKNYRAAALRYREATNWNAGNAEAWLRLAEAEEKRHNAKAANEAWAKFLELKPDAKEAPEIRKKLGKTK
jgi:tetratricopeptide (TPR) repeat protein